jgi:hypothetical protein
MAHYGFVKFRNYNKGPAGRHTPRLGLDNFALKDNSSMGRHVNDVTVRNPSGSSSLTHFRQATSHVGTGAEIIEDQ